MCEESENGVNNARKAGYSQIKKVLFFFFFFFAVKRIWNLGKGVGQ